MTAERSRTPTRGDRKRIAREAARMMFAGDQTCATSARRAAAIKLGFTPSRRRRDWPTTRDIRRHIDALARLHAARHAPANLRQVRLATLLLMWKLRDYSPRAARDTVMAPPRPGSPVRIHVRAHQTDAVLHALNDPHLAATPVGARRSHGDRPASPTRIRVMDLTDPRSPTIFELILVSDARSGARDAMDSTGVPPGTISVSDLEALVRSWYPDVDLDDGHRSQWASWADPLTVFKPLLARLDGVKLDPRTHPEGDALYHGLQAFELARWARPYDEEFALAALLHDVGRGLHAGDPVAAALEALDGLITPRTAFLIRHHVQAQALRLGTLPARARARLQASEWFEDLVEWADIDAAARCRGVDVCSVDEALTWVRSMGHRGEPFEPS